MTDAPEQGGRLRLGDAIELDEGERIFGAVSAGGRYGGGAAINGRRSYGR